MRPSRSGSGGLSEIAAERNSTIIFPLRFELLRALEHLAGPTTPADPGSPADEPDGFAT